MSKSKNEVIESLNISDLVFTHSDEIFITCEYDLETNFWVIKNWRREDNSNLFYVEMDREIDNGLIKELFLQQERIATGFIVLEWIMDLKANNENL